VFLIREFPSMFFKTSSKHVNPLKFKQKFYDETLDAMISSGEVGVIRLVFSLMAETPSNDE